MSRPSQVIVLAEDKRHLNFARHFLKGLGYGSHQVRNIPLPAGHGCGEQLVRKRYAESVSALREREGKKTATALLVIIDADTLSVADRQKQLQQELLERALPSRGASEAVTHLIPKRSIETWILCLGGQQSISENQAYKFSVQDGDVKAAAQAFRAAVRSVGGPPTHFVPSLCDGLIEARRIPSR